MPSQIHYAKSLVASSNYWSLIPVHVTTSLSAKAIYEPTKIAPKPIIIDAITEALKAAIATIPVKSARSIIATKTAGMEPTTAIIEVIVPIIVTYYTLGGLCDVSSLA